MLIDPRHSHIYTGWRASLYTGEKSLASPVETRCSSLSGTGARTSLRVRVGGAYWSAFTRRLRRYFFFLRAKKALNKVDRGEKERLHRKLLERSLDCHRIKALRETLLWREGRRDGLWAIQTGIFWHICNLGRVSAGARDLLLLLSCCSALVELAMCSTSLMLLRTFVKTLFLAGISCELALAELLQA